MILVRFSYLLSYLFSCQVRWEDQCHSYECLLKLDLYLCLGVLLYIVLQGYTICYAIADSHVPQKCKCYCKCYYDWLLTSCTLIASFHVLFSDAREEGGGRGGRASCRDLQRTNWLLLVEQQELWRWHRGAGSVSRTAFHQTQPGGIRRTPLLHHALQVCF